MEILIWPGVVVIIAIVAMFVFCTSFGDLIGRISGAGKDGVTFVRRQERQTTPKDTLSFKDLMDMPINSSVLARENFIKEKFHEFDLKSEEEKVSVLIRSLALGRLELEYRNISSLIFGSQMQLLLMLSGTLSPSKSEKVNDIFEAAKSKFPDIHKNRKLEEWLEFLISTGLVIKNKNEIDISQYGSDFLKFIVDARLAYERIG